MRTWCSAVSRADANLCFVCGPENPIGLKIPFRIDDGVCRGSFTPGTYHAGFDGVTHGGIIFSVLDDAMANWLYLQGARGFTAKCEIRYRKPLPLGVAVALECRLKQRKGRLVILGSHAARDDDATLVAEAEARFIVDDFGRLDG